MKFAFFSLLNSVALMSLSAFAAPANISVSKQLNREKRGCVRYLTDKVQSSLSILRAEDTQVHLGTYAELEKLLRFAGVSSSKANAAARAVKELRHAAFRYPALHYSALVFDDLVKAKKLLVCVVSAKCEFAHAEENNLLFTEQYEGIILVPPPKDNLQDFAVNFFGTIASSAGEQIAMNWLLAGHAHMQKTGLFTDTYYEQFAPKYDGSFPPTPGSFDQAFIFTFMTLYKTLVTNILFAITHPELAQINTEHLAKGTYEQLMFGYHHDVTAPITRRLGITEQNFFQKTVEITNVMVTTINQRSTQM